MLVNNLYVYMGMYFESLFTSNLRALFRCNQLK